MNLTLHRSRREFLMSAVVRAPLGQPPNKCLSADIIRVQNHQSCLFEMSDEHGIYQNKQKGCRQGHCHCNKGKVRLKTKYGKRHRGNNNRQRHKNEQKDQPVEPFQFPELPAQSKLYFDIIKISGEIFCNVNVFSYNLGPNKVEEPFSFEIKFLFRENSTLRRYPIFLFHLVLFLKYAIF